MAPRRFHLRVAAEEQHLAEIRDFLQEVGEKLLIPGKILANTKLAVDEACTNIVKHGYRGEAGSIEVVVTGNGREFSIAIHDQGRSFDLRNVKSPDLKMYVETRRRGGLGVFLMNQLMDEVRYRAGHDGNVLTMSKRLGRSVPRMAPGEGSPRRTLRFTYTVQPSARSRSSLWPRSARFTCARSAGSSRRCWARRARRPRTSRDRGSTF